jgi:2-keto-4-pentenoate hydratase/2-oxohepta-3-ene-1,7-dioic acid hydratase in catechol pathway
MVDYEGELGVVIGQTARKVSAADAHEYVAGYLIVDDVSVRDWQFKAPTMTLGKTFDTHGPIGPWLVTPDEIPDPHSLGIKTWVNDQLLQDGNTKEMLFDIWQQIETLSIACTLEPGDIIATGPPPASASPASRRSS